MISCLMPVFNRYPHDAWLVEEAVECFLRQQGREDHELIIINDTPGQSIWCDAPNVRVLQNFNFGRFSSLSAKLQFGIERAQGDMLCRWDDDDISLPWRLITSGCRIIDRQEWHPLNHWYDERGTIKGETRRPGNTHNMAIWRRDVLPLIGGYPPGSNGEDQAFNQRLAVAGLPDGEMLPPERIFYLYRWGVSRHHLSGSDGQSGWERAGREPIVPGTFEIKPRWYADHVERARRSVETFSPSPALRYAPQS